MSARIAFRHHFDQKPLNGWITILVDDESVSIVILAHEGVHIPETRLDYVDDQWLTLNELSDRREVSRSVNDALQDAVSNYVHRTASSGRALYSAATKVGKEIARILPASLN